MCADKWTECWNGGLCFSALWVYEFIAPCLPSSLREAPLTLPDGAHRGQAGRRTAAGPLAFVKKVTGLKICPRLM